MSLKYNKKIIPFAKKLRKNATREENHLWYDFLSTYPIRFQRQKVIGEYITDFYCHKAKLVIELDGAQHYEENAIKYDEMRTEFLNKYGIEVIRFLNRDINENFTGVCEYLDILIGERGFLNETTI